MGSFIWLIWICILWKTHFLLPFPLTIPQSLLLLLFYLLGLFFCSDLFQGGHIIAWLLFTLSNYITFLLFLGCRKFKIIDVICHFLHFPELLRISWPISRNYWLWLFFFKIALRLLHLQFFKLFLLLFLFQLFPFDPCFCNSNLSWDWIWNSSNCRVFNWVFYGIFDWFLEVDYWPSRFFDRVRMRNRNRVIPIEFRDLDFLHVLGQFPLLSRRCLLKINLECVRVVI